ncbi:MAG: hypothetical protein RLZZ210_1049 [Pseudomonadota bacterium]|jgi:aspartate 1-decarboxylase
MHKLHFVTVNVAYKKSSNINNSKPIVLIGENLLKYLNINNFKCLEWHYWSRSNLHRYANIDIELLNYNIAQQYNILNISNAILALNFDDEYILPQNNIKHINNSNSSEYTTYNEIAVIASFKHMQEHEYMEYRAKIALFEPKSYNQKQGNTPKYFKDGVCIKNYLAICEQYKNGEYNNKIPDLNTKLDKLNINHDLLEIKYSNNSNHHYNKNFDYTYSIKQQVLTESLLDYEGSTGIDFIKLYNSGILPQEMVYFYKDNQIIHVNKNTPLCTYAIVEHAYSNKWTANGGIALHLEPYLKTQQQLDISTLNHESKY